MFRINSEHPIAYARLAKRLGLIAVGCAVTLLISKAPIHAQQAPANANGNAQPNATPGAPGGAQAGRGPGRGFGFRRPAQADWNDHNGWVSLFDGKTLDNWKGNKNVWSVEDGQIVGTASSDNPVGTTYLIWTGGQPANFTLKLDFMLAGTAPNTGIQFRSFIRPPGFPGRGGVGFGGNPTVVCSDQEAINDMNPSTASTEQQPGPGGFGARGGATGLGQSGAPNASRGGLGGAAGRGPGRGRGPSEEMAKENAPYWLAVLRQISTRKIPSAEIFTIKTAVARWSFAAR